MVEQKNNSQSVFVWLITVIESVNDISQIPSCELLIDNFRKNYQSDEMADTLEKIKTRKKNELNPQHT